MELTHLNYNSFLRRYHITNMRSSGITCFFHRYYEFYSFVLVLFYFIRFNLNFRFDKVTMDGGHLR